jgi:hypothetical protein
MRIFIIILAILVANGMLSLLYKSVMLAIGRPAGYTGYSFNLVIVPAIVLIGMKILRNLTKSILNELQSLPELPANIE